MDIHSLPFIKSLNFCDNTEWAFIFGVKFSIDKVQSFINFLGAFDRPSDS